MHFGILQSRYELDIKLEEIAQEILKTLFKGRWNKVHGDGDNR